MRHTAGAMQGYYAYFLDPDGHIQLRVDLPCEDDEAAKEKVTQLVDGHDVELWNGNRKVAIFKHHE
jgi:hypothetical protein